MHRYSSSMLISTHTARCSSNIAFKSLYKSSHRASGACTSSSRPSATSNASNDDYTAINEPDTLTVEYQGRTIQVCHVRTCHHPQNSTHPQNSNNSPLTKNKDPSWHYSAHSTLACQHHCSQRQRHHDQLSRLGNLWNLCSGNRPQHSTPGTATAQCSGNNALVTPTTQQQQPTLAARVSSAHYGWRSHYHQNTKKAGILGPKVSRAGGGQHKQTHALGAT